MNTPAPAVGFIGLGDMGGAIARRIVEGGFSTTLWARRSASLDAFRDTAARFADSPAALATTSDIVGLCVFGDADVYELALGGNGLIASMRPGSILLIHSTISVATTLEIANAASHRGIAVLDAPVSGARIRATSGRLSIMAGGEKAAFDRVLPLMRCYGESILHLGASGSGQKMKLLNNVLGFANLRMAHLALELADRLGLENTAARQVLRSGSAASFNLDILLDRLLPDAAFARHAVTMTEKDTRLFQDVCRLAGIEPTLMDRLAEEAIQVVDQLGRR